MTWSSGCRRTAVLAALLSLTVTGCGAGSQSGDGDDTTGPVPTTSAPSTSTAPEPTTSAPSTSTAPEPTPPMPPPVERDVWEWAIGRSMDDPTITPYLADLTDDDAVGGAMVKELGFELLIDSTGTVTRVMLVNDERRLGYTENTFAAYDGRLPGGLTWDMTTPDVIGTLGEPDTSYTAGMGAEATLTYADVDGHQVVVSLAARHQSEIPTSLIHTITVSAAG
jgi:hypothetical protein